MAAPAVELDTTAFLPPPPKPGQHGDDEFQSWCASPCCCCRLPAAGCRVLHSWELRESPPPHTHTHLPAGSHACLIACSCGGLVVTSADGAIVCSNTLDDRLRITYSSNLPAVRALLFGGAAA